MCDKLHKLEDALEDQMLQKSFDLIYEYWDELGELDKLGELCGLDELECHHGRIEIRDSEYTYMDCNDIELLFQIVLYFLSTLDF